MKRKVIRAGPSSIAVSLPSKWVKQIGIKAGDEIEVEEKGNQITLNSRRISQEAEAVIDIPTPAAFIRRLLVSPYLKGYNQIRVNYEDPAVYSLVQDAINKLLLGFEIVEQQKKSCVIKNIAAQIEEDYDTLLRRYFFQLKNILSNLVDALEHKNKDELEHVLHLDETIDKLHLFLRRILSIQGYKDDSKSKSLYYIICLMENISDHCKYICLHIKKTDCFPSSDFIDIFKIAQKYFNLYCELFYKPGVGKVLQFKKTYLGLKEEIPKIFEKSTPHDFALYHHVSGIFEMIHCLSEEL